MNKPKSYPPPFADREFAREAGKKGGIAAARARARKGLDKESLGPLESHEDAKRWLRLIGAAVVTGVLDKGDAVAGIKAVDSWLRAEGDRVTMKVVEELKGEVERLKSELAGSGRRRLRSV